MGFGFKQNPKVPNPTQKSLIYKKYSQIKLKNPIFLVFFGSGWEILGFLGLTQIPRLFWIQMSL
jgi:hypothetical protein